MISPAKALLGAGSGREQGTLHNVLSPVYVEADEDDWKGNLDLTDVDFGDDDYDPCEDPDLFRESLLNQW